MLHITLYYILIEMNHNSRDTLHRVNQNDPSLAELRLADNSLYYGDDGEFQTIVTIILPLEQLLQIMLRKV